MGRLNFDRYLKTEKQKSFEYDFFKDAEKYETWDEIKIGEEYESERTFEVKLEDMKSLAEGVLDPNPLFNDEEYAKKSPFGEIMAHPLFCVAIAFWCIGLGRGSWIRSAGAINPGQKIELYEPFRVGDVISIKQKSYDKWIRRRHHYVTYQLDFVDQNNRLKARWWVTLILPPSRADLMWYVGFGR